MSLINKAREVFNKARGLHNERFTLGDVLRDTVTGFTGTAVNRVIFLNGCVQLCLTPVPKEGEEPNGKPTVAWFDYQRLEFVRKGVYPTRNNAPVQQEIPLGSKVRCRLTSFRGVALTRNENIVGDISYGVQPDINKDKPGEYPEALTFESGLLEIEEDEPVPPVKRSDTGGPARRSELPRNVY